MGSHKQNIENAYKEYSDAIFRYCLFKLSDREKALDLVQDTFTRVWQYVQKGNEIENMKTFLYTTARNLIIDEYRKKKSFSLDSLMEQGLDPQIEIEEALYTSFDVDRVLGCVKQLPENYSSIIVMRYVNDLSVKEIAEIMNETENVVSVRIHRGLSKLRMLVTS
jgi:RNA polymerase sigma-70 factor (ECF subfamily)